MKSLVNIVIRSHCHKLCSVTLRYFISFGRVEHQPVLLSLPFYCCIIYCYWQDLRQYITLCLRENGYVEKKLSIPFAAEKGKYNNIILPCKT